MKAVRHGCKSVNISLLVWAMGLVSGTALAEQDVEASWGADSPAAHTLAYRPVAHVVPDLTQVVFYYPEGTLPASLYVDGELQSALLPGEFSVFCVAPGEHAVVSYFNDQPTYQGKQSGQRSQLMKGGETYFLQVNPGSAGSTTALAERAQAEPALKSLRKQTRIVNRASQVKSCEYVNGNDAVLIQEKVLFQFGKSDYRGMIPASREKLYAVIDFIKQGHGVTEIQLQGYTDATGQDEANQRLSTARVQTIRQVLMDAGIAPSLRVTSEGMGVAPSAEGCMVGTQHQATGCNINSRRVDIVVR